MQPKQPWGEKNCGQSAVLGAEGQFEWLFLPLRSASPGMVSRYVFEGWETIFAVRGSLVAAFWHHSA